MKNVKDIQILTIFSVVRKENAKPVKQKALVNNMFNKVIHKIVIY